jgi:solute carrier family 25 phosphate transporter 23/24/25/41
MAMGGMGGVMAGLMTYPNDTIRRLLQLQGSRGTATEFTGYLF